MTKCWEWDGIRDKDGYGIILRRVGRYPNGQIKYKRIRAHRNAMKAKPGQVVCHRCDNPPCVRPSHLFVGTMADNQQDMARKGRSTWGEKHPRARLMQEEVDEMRKARKKGVPIAVLAKRYRVCETTVSDIANRKRWARKEAK